MLGYQEELRSRAEIRDLAEYSDTIWNASLRGEGRMGRIICIPTERDDQDARQGQLEESLWKYADGELQCIGIHNIIWEKMKTDFHVVLFCAPPAEPNLLT
jgi:hypothetical protein